MAWLTWKEEPHFWPAMAELHEQPPQQLQQGTICRGVHQLNCMARHSRGRPHTVQACAGQRFCLFAVTEGHWEQGTSRLVGPASTCNVRALCLLHQGLQSWQG